MKRLVWLVVLGCSVGPPAPVAVSPAPNAPTVAVQTNPFGIVVRDPQGNVLIESAPAQPGTPYGPLAVTNEIDQTVSTLITGWDYYKGEDQPWTPVSQVTSVMTDGPATIVSLATGIPNQPSMTVTITADGSGVRVSAAMDDVPYSGGYAINRVSMSFVMHDDAPGAVGDHFFGTGERFVDADQRGQYRYMWVEDRYGAENAELTETSPPSPAQAEETYIPIPWLMNPRGFGMLQHTTFRTVYHLGDEVPNAWRVEAWEPKIDFTLWADQDPKNLVADLTSVTGRAPEVPDWIFAPRRRADIPVDAETARLRAAHIPTTMIDTALHYLPSGIGTLDAPSVTADIHAQGFKAIAYFCSFVDQNYHPVFDEAAANGYLVKNPEGQPYIVFNEPLDEGIVDFTNPAAVTWYQGLLTQALNDGWDGWMYDFGEYIPLDAVMYNGMTGEQAHDLYPVLYQQAAFDLLQQLRPANYLFFVRSGYTGTSGIVPMTWGGDADTDFSVGKGLPAELDAALNLGMSGVPFWGSDISGYHYLYNPPPDKELYIRWTELGALSGDMHDENEGAGNMPVSARWQIWDDQETTDDYQMYAQLHTQLVPYFRIAANEARATGLPIMRHLYLYFPFDPNVWTLTDEYLLGDWLLAAPIVARGATSRSVYLPEPMYWDFFAGTRVAGAGTITANATLDQVPLYARAGAIIPMLSPDVETLVPATNGSGVISLADRANVLYLEIFTGGSTSITLGDGTEISQTAPPGPYTPTTPPTAQNATFVQAADASDLATCSACWLDDPASSTLDISLQTSGDVINAGAVTVNIASSPNVKQFVMHLHH